MQQPLAGSLDLGWTLLLYLAGLALLARWLGAEFAPRFTAAIPNKGHKVPRGAYSTQGAHSTRRVRRER